MTKLIILAAGTGSRLRPHTDDKPKCMVDVFGLPILIHQLQVIKQYINDANIALVTGYQSQVLENICTPEMHTFHNPHYDSTNMVYSLFQAREFMDDDIIISYGDIIYEKSVFEKILTHDADFSVVIDKNFQRLWQIRSENPIEDTESLILDDNNMVLELGQKVQSMNDPQGQYIGLIKISKKYIKSFTDFYDALRYNSADKHAFENMYMTDFIQAFINQGIKVSAVDIHSGWIEVDTVKDLDVYSKLYTQGKLDNFISLPS